MRCNKKNLEAIAETALVYYSKDAHKASLCDLTVQRECKKKIYYLLIYNVATYA